MVQSFMIFSKFVDFYPSVSFNTVWFFIRTLWFCPRLSVSFSLLIFPASVMTLGWEIFWGKAILKRIDFALSFELHGCQVLLYYHLNYLLSLFYIYIKENMGVSFAMIGRDILLPWSKWSKNPLAF